MKKTLLLSAVLFFGFCINILAQGTFTEHVKSRPSGGKGSVIIVQEKEIEDLVNQRGTTSAKASSEGKSNVTTTEEGDSVTAKTGKRYKARGFRIQIFTGGNSKQARIDAERMERRSRSAFPELSVYKHFVSPRWICRVGDFKTYEDAAKYAELIRKANISNEVRVVKCVVWLRE